MMYRVTVGLDQCGSKGVVGCYHAQPQVIPDLHNLVQILSLIHI